MASEVVGIEKIHLPIWALDMLFNWPFLNVIRVR